MNSYFRGIVSILGVVFTLQGCTVVSAVDAAASTAIDITVGAVKTTGKVVGEVVDVVIPDGDD